MARKGKPESAPAKEPEAKQRGKPKSTKVLGQEVKPKAQKAKPKTENTKQKPTTAKTKAKPQKQQKQLTTAEWRKIRLEYIRGKTTYKKLAEKWGISDITIRHRASLEGWRKKKLNADTKATQKAVERMCDARAREFERIALINDRMDEVLDNIISFISSQPPKKYDDLRGVESLTKAINTVVMTKRDLYNMPTEETKAKIEALREKSKLDRQKFEEEQAEKAASKQAAESTIFKVTIESDSEEEVILDE